MDYLVQKPKIEFYKTRTFSEKLSDTINFLRECWKPMLKYFLYLMLPCSIVLAFFMNHFWNGYMSLLFALEKMSKPFDGSEALSQVINVLLLVIVYLAAYILLIALIFALVRLYRRREDRLKNLTDDELKPELMWCLRRATILTLACMGIGLVVLLVIVGIIALIVSINAGLGLTVAALIYCGVLVIAMPLLLMTPIYMMEDDINVIEAILKAFHLGFPTWGGIFAVYFVIGIIASIIQTVTMGPWYILFLIKTALTVSGNFDGSFASSIFYTIGEYLTCVLQCLGMLLSLVITNVGILIQYGHAADLIDGVGVAQKIEKFDELDNF